MVKLVKLEQRNKNNSCCCFPRVYLSTVHKEPLYYFYSYRSQVEKTDKSWSYPTSLLPSLKKSSERLEMFGRKSNSSFLTDPGPGHPSPIVSHTPAYDAYLFLPLKKPHTVGVKHLVIRSVIGWCVGNYWREGDQTFQCAEFQRQMGIDSLTQSICISLPCNSWLMLNSRRSHPAVNLMRAGYLPLTSLRVAVQRFIHRTKISR